MKNILGKIEKIIDQILEKKIDVLTWSAGFAGVIGVRMLVERIIIPATDSSQRVVTDYLHNVFFFLLSYLVIWLILSKIMQIKPQKLAVLLLGAAWLIVLPPLFDIARTGGGVYWSFYSLGTFPEILANLSTFFGKMPSGIVYFGTKIIFATTLLLVLDLVYIKTKNVIKAVFAILLAYLTLFLMGTFPSWIAYAFYFFTDQIAPYKVQGFQIAQFFGSPKQIFGINFKDLQYAFPYSLDLIYYLILVLLLGCLFLAINKEKIVAIIKNARYPQLIYHAGLLAVGLSLGFLAYPSHMKIDLFSVVAVLDLLAAVWLGWLSSVVVNDIYDFEIDQISNPNRPLQEKIFEKSEYLRLGILFFILSFLGGLVVDVKFALLLFFYQFLAWAYSAPPFRLKKIPGIATFVSSLASLLVLFVGFILVSGDQNIVGLSWRVIILLVVAFTLSLPIKDFKDIEGDRQERIWTIPVLAGEEKARFIVAIGTFISFMLSVFLLNEFRLFWWALLFGIISFLIIINKKPRQLFWWVLGAVSIYGIILVKILFL